MSAGDGFFVDSNLLLYYVDQWTLENRSARRSGSIIFGWPERVA